MRTVKRIFTGFLALLLTVALLPCVAKADGCPEAPDGKHDWSDGDVTAVATCTEPGSVVRVCNLCGETAEVTIPALGHDWSSWEIEGAPTCTESTYETRVCKRCSTNEERTVAALGHSWDSGKVTKEASCLAEGVRTYTCTRCGETKTESIAKTGHNWDSGKVTKEATCKAEGVKTYTCSVCGETRKEAVPKTAHTPVTVPGKAATCTESGYTEGEKCSVCGAILTQQKTIGAKGHSWDSGKITKEPTETEDGIKTYTCRRCGRIRKEAIPAKTLNPSLTQTVVIAEDAGKGKAVDGAIVEWDCVITNTGDCPITCGHDGLDDEVNDWRLTGFTSPDGTYTGLHDGTEVSYVLQPGESYTVHRRSPVFENAPGVFEIEYPGPWGCSGTYIKEDGTEGTVKGNSVTVDIPLTEPGADSEGMNPAFTQVAVIAEDAGKGKAFAGAFIEFFRVITNIGNCPLEIVLSEEAGVIGYEGPDGFVPYESPEYGPDARYLLQPGESVTLYSRVVVSEYEAENGRYKDNIGCAAFYTGEDGTEGKIGSMIVIDILLTKDGMNPAFTVVPVIAEDAGKGKAFDGAFLEFSRIITNTGDCPLEIVLSEEAGVIGYEGPDGFVPYESPEYGPDDRYLLQPGESVTLYSRVKVSEYEAENGQYEDNIGCAAFYDSGNGTKGSVGSTIHLVIPVTAE